MIVMIGQSCRGFTLRIDFPDILPAMSMDGVGFRREVGMQLDGVAIQSEPSLMDATDKRNHWKGGILDRIESRPNTVRRGPQNVQIAVLQAAHRTARARIKFEEQIAFSQSHPHEKPPETCRRAP